MKRSTRAPATPQEATRALLDDDGICWFPIRHHSPACAWRLRDRIRALRPAAVLVEGPDDATPLIPALLDPETRPPVSILSTWVDRKNQYGLNGVLTASDDVPVRYRSWWPLVDYSPEYVALVEGHRVGAELAFIDAPLPATLAFDQARRGEISATVDDRRLAESAYFEALRARGRRRSFAELWESTFEVDALDGDGLRERLSTFAWCTRAITSDAAFDEDGTSLREAHMRWHVDQARKRHAGWIVVVTGAFHTVALPWTRGKRAKQKADRDTTTLLCAHSFPALARLTDQNPQPAYGQAVWDALVRGEARPHAAAASELITRVVRSAREAGQAVSTADAVAAWAVASQLAALRGNAAPTRFDVHDALESTLWKGDAAVAGPALAPALRRVLVGERVGRVAESAGRAPLISAYYAACREHRLDVSGAHKVVRCDLGRQSRHRAKSAFLHACDLLELPMFAAIDREGGRGSHFRGPDPVAGTDLHLLGESWGVCWTEEVDDRLVELADRGATVAEVAAGLVRERIEVARGDAQACARQVLGAARLALPELIDPALDAVHAALVEDRRFLALTAALGDLWLLVTLRDGLGGDRAHDALAAVWEAAALALPAIGRAGPDEVEEHVRGLQDLVRVALVIEERPLDRRLLVEQLEALLAGPDGEPGARGAALGVLYSLGHRRESDVAAALDLLLRGAGAAHAGRFLEGVFLSGRSALLAGDRLLASIDAVLGALDWDAFRALLPDLRRAFTQFIPSEIDALGRRVAARVGLSELPDPDRRVPDGLVACVAVADQRASDAFSRWWDAPTVG